MARREDVTSTNRDHGQWRRRAAPGIERVDEAENDADERRRDIEAFQRRLEAGEYRELLPAGLVRAMGQAAADGDLGHEIGALRVAMARLLALEEDPTKLATTLARLTTASVQAHKARRALCGELADDLTGALTQVLAEIG